MSVEHGTQALAVLLAAAAHGRFPPADGTLSVVPAPVPYRGAVVAFTAHSVIAADIPAEAVRARLPTDDLGAPMARPFLTWLGHQLGARPGLVDVVLVHRERVSSSLQLSPAERRDGHPRVARALQHRHDVRVYTDALERGVVILGRGLVGRWELSLELDPAARGRGLGRQLIAAGRALVPADDPVFAQVSPGNAQSMRAFLAAGFRPIGAEVLFP
jgi:GNAT superfamily N-acetyltransferase